MYLAHANRMHQDTVGGEDVTGRRARVPAGPKVPSARSTGPWRCRAAGRSL